MDYIFFDLRRDDSPHVRAMDRYYSQYTLGVGKGNNLISSGNNVVNSFMFQKHVFSANCASRSSRFRSLYGQGMSALLWATIAHGILTSDPHIVKKDFDELSYLYALGSSYHELWRISRDNFSSFIPGHSTFRSKAIHCLNSLMERSAIFADENSKIIMCGLSGLRLMDMSAHASIGVVPEDIKLLSMLIHRGLNESRYDVKTSHRGITKINAGHLLNDLVVVSGRPDIRPLVDF